MMVENYDLLDAMNIIRDDCGRYFLTLHTYFLILYKRETNIGCSAFGSVLKIL